MRQMTHRHTHTTGAHYCWCCAAHHEAHHQGLTARIDDHVTCVVLLGAPVGCSSTLMRAGHHALHDHAHTGGTTTPSTKPDAAGCGSPGTATQSRHAAHRNRAPGTKWALSITFAAGRTGSCPADYHGAWSVAAVAIFGIDACRPMRSFLPAKHISNDCRLDDKLAARSAAAAPKHSLIISMGDWRHALSFGS
jgi:hypothetical protein